MESGRQNIGSGRQNVGSGTGQLQNVGGDQNLSDTSSEMLSGGQSQARRDGILSQGCDQSLDMNRPSAGTMPHHTDNSSYAAQATNFLHQTGEQMKNMAQGATTAVKNTLGMSTDQHRDNFNSATNQPIGSNPSFGSSNPSNKIV